MTSDRCQNNDKIPMTKPSRCINCACPITFHPSPRELHPPGCAVAGGGQGDTAVELSELRRTWSAEFIPLPADLAEPEGGGRKSALLNSTAVGQGEGHVPLDLSQVHRPIWKFPGHWSFALGSQASRRPSPR